MILYFILGVFPAFLLPIYGHHCGKLRESQLYNRKEITAPDEYTWIGRVGYVYGNRTEFSCFSVLIHRRYAIINAFCILDNLASFIVFGDWRENKDITVGDCLVEGITAQCSPPPQRVDIEELVVHPGYNRLDDYNFGLAKLVENVIFSDFVQPLCLPPAGETESNHIAQRLEMAGFRRPLRKGDTVDKEGEWRRKVQVHTASMEFCRSLGGNNWPNRTQHHICALGKEENTLYFGSPLMGIEVVDGKPRNFYLVGLPGSVELLGHPSNLSMLLFTSIFPFRNWIVKNMELDYN
ncbi:CLIP domain-containing serine protease HP8-like [Drosophila takahashii]|uniref:CLIP domain-containing serine protease HP8-like n=1 Tax=Drosophila takahashii TaxID=29030 RepID=UPI001CF86955|nr:CLIP domain-containing serine protease 2-like [Drosophila takahashii]